MLELVNRLHQHGVSIVMVTHAMDDVAQYATRAVVLDKGEVFMDGTPEAVFSDAPKLEKIGLDVPAVCRLGMLLREKGIPFPENVFRQDAALDALRALLKGEVAHA